MAIVRELVDKDHSDSGGGSAAPTTPSGWILKQGQVNNALGLLVFRDVAELVSLLVDSGEKDNGTDKNSFACTTKSVLQEYIVDPLLLDGRKFHLRVNVLVAGGDLSSKKKK